MQSNVLTVARHGDKWSIASGRDILVLAETKDAADALARSAARILQGSGAKTEVRVSAEPRSFAAEKPGKKSVVTGKDA